MSSAASEIRPFTIALVQMPFAPLKQAPLALLQLQAAVEQRFGELVSVRIVYPSYDFASHLGLRLYYQIAYADSDLRPGEMSGLGDWFFRHIAFPDVPENVDAYRQRYFGTPEQSGFVNFDDVLAKRVGAASLLEEIIDRYDLRLTDLVGFTSMFAQHAACLAMARLLKSAAVTPIVVIGGANCEGPMGRALANNVPDVDAVFSGPGLKSFPDFVRASMAGAVPGERRIRGVHTRRKATSAGATVKGGLALAVLQPAAAPATGVVHDDLGEELDINVPLALDYAGFLDTFERAFNGTLDPVLTFETSRGCWWGAKAHCPFCGLNGSTMAYRAMQPRQAIATFEQLFQHAAKCRVFECVDNIMPIDYPESVFPHITAPASTTIYYEVKADLTAADLASMARAGVRFIQPGIEALATPSLRALKKGTNAVGNVLLLRNCLALGVMPLWNLLIGIPREERPREIYAKYAADIPAMMHLPPPWTVFKVRVDRFSPYFTRPDEYGLRIRPKAFYNFVYPFDDDVLFDLAYYFDDANAGTAEYAEAADEWHPVLRELIREWFSGWCVADATKRPALFVDNGRCTTHGAVR